MYEYVARDRQDSNTVGWHNYVISVCLCVNLHITGTRDIGWKNGLGLLIILASFYYVMWPIKCVWSIMPKFVPHAHIK